MVVVKIIGLLDQVLLTNIYSMFGEEYATMGSGLFSNAYEIFVVIFTVATGGLPIAISRLVSERFGKDAEPVVEGINSVFFNSRHCVIYDNDCRQFYLCKNN